MASLPLYQLDAFSPRLFGGNPAALIPLQTWLPDRLMQQIAAENNLSETAFFAPDDRADFQLRWFTPAAEVELCGHATLATAWWLFHHGGWAQDEVRFQTRSGQLTAQHRGQEVEINLPSRASEPDDSACDLIAAALGEAPTELRRGANWIAVLDKATSLQKLAPDFAALKRLHPLGLIVTAPGQDCDFVSRYFAPSFGIDEDPVTGSAHADLAPYWASRLGKSTMTARQLSARGGEIVVRIESERVFLRGRCVLYLNGQIEVPLHD